MAMVTRGSRVPRTGTSLPALERRALSLAGAIACALAALAACKSNKEPETPRAIADANICQADVAERAGRALDDPRGGYTLVDLAAEAERREAALSAAATAAEVSAEPMTLTPSPQPDVPNVAATAASGVIPALAPALPAVISALPPSPAVSLPPPPASSVSDAAQYIIGVRGGNQLLAIDPRDAAYRPVLPDICAGHTSVVRICVSATGSVSSVNVVRPSIRLLDSQLPLVMGTWRYRPYIVDGRPMPFCYFTFYTVE